MNRVMWANQATHANVETLVSRGIRIFDYARFAEPLRERIRTRAQEVSAEADIEIEHIQAVLDQVGWRIRGAGGAADLLGLRPTTLESRMTKLGILRSVPLSRTLGSVCTSRRFGSADTPRATSALPR